MNTAIRSSHCEGGVRGSPKSQYRPAMSCRPSRAMAIGRCSLGGWEQPRCGTQIVGIPSTSEKMSFGSEPPELGRIAGRAPVVLAIEAAAHCTAVAVGARME
jgi:hypothetical protein